MFPIRLLEEQDLPAYRSARLHCLHTYPESFTTNVQEEMEKEAMLFELHIKTADPDNFLFGAFDLDVCIGLCGFLRHQRQRIRHSGMLVHMYVHPKYTGRGIGKQLVSAVTEQAFSLSGMEQITLNVVADNERAVRVYEKLGFEKYGLLENFFRMDKGYADQLMMVKTKPTK